MHGHGFHGRAVDGELSLGSTRSYSSLLWIRRRQAKWKVLRRLGVPEVMISLILSFHQDMCAKIHMDGKLMRANWCEE